MVFFSFTVQWLVLKALQTPTILYLVKRLYMLISSYANAIKSKIINIKHTLVFIHTFKNSTEVLKSFFVNIFTQKSEIFSFILLHPYKRVRWEPDKKEKNTLGA